MSSDKTPPAWVKLPDPDAMQGMRGDNHPYSFGYVPAMGRLIAAHPRIGPAFSMLFATVMFALGALSRGDSRRGGFGTTAENAPGVLVHLSGRYGLWATGSWREPD